MVVWYLRNEGFDELMDKNQFPTFAFLIYLMRVPLLKGDDRFEVLDLEFTKSKQLC